MKIPWHVLADTCENGTGKAMLGAKVLQASHLRVSYLEGQLYLAFWIYSGNFYKGREPVEVIVQHDAEAATELNRADYCR